MEYLEKLFNLKDKVVVITGGLGILGTQYASALLEAGAKVAVFDLVSPDSSHPLVKIAKKQPVEFATVDITDKNQVVTALSQVVKKWGTPDVLINNAALDFPPASGAETFENYPVEKWEKVLRVNVTGTMVCCQVVGEVMAKNKGGSIINISSIYGLVSPDQRIYQDFIKPAAYSTSKSAILNLTRYLATYWGDKNVRVNTLTPGGVFNNQPESFVEKYAAKVPLGRMADKQDYNGAILFLASDASKYMTGSNLIIDGGWTAW